VDTYFDKLVVDQEHEDFYKMAAVKDFGYNNNIELEESAIFFARYFRADENGKIPEPAQMDTDNRYVEEITYTPGTLVARICAYCRWNVEDVIRENPDQPVKVESYVLFEGCVSKDVETDWIVVDRFFKNQE
jgi:hypothetical protein